MTIMVTVAFRPEHPAVIVAVPLARAVTSPVVDTVAIVVSEDDQAMVWPGTGTAPTASGIAVSRNVVPAESVLVPGGPIATTATARRCVFTGLAHDIVPRIMMTTAARRAG
jgi:hypothetical protein